MLRIRVLLVDDHQMVVEGFRRVLTSSRDIDVVAVAGTVAAGLTAAHEHEPDVVVADYSLPDGTGAELAAKLIEELAAVKVVMITGSDNPAALRAAFEAGCVGYVNKTSAFDLLPAAIRAAAAGHTFLTHQDLERLQAERPQASGLALTAREMEILRLMAEGLSSRAIAGQLFVSLNTVRTHAQTILEKLGAHSKLEAVAHGRKLGLLDGP